jgi:hypothetical protein
VISQKAQIKAHQASLEAYAAEEQLEREKARAEARARVLKDFERGLGLGGVKPVVKPRADTERRVELARKPDHDDVEVKLIEAPAGDGRGVKRKFEFDESAVEKLAREAEDAALKAIEAEQVSRAGSVDDEMLIRPTGPVEKSQAALLLAANVDARSPHRAPERRETADHVQRRRTPASAGAQEPPPGAFHLPGRIKDGPNEVDTNMPVVLARDLKRDEIDPVDLDASGARDRGGRSAGEKGGGGQEGKGRGRVWARGVLDVCGYDRQAGEAVSRLRGTCAAGQGYD